MQLRNVWQQKKQRKARRVLSKLLASVIEFLAGFGQALPKIADNQATRLEIKRPIKEARAKLRATRIKRKQLRAERKLRRRAKKSDT